MVKREKRKTDYKQKGASGKAPQFVKKLLRNAEGGVPYKYTNEK